MRQCLVNQWLTKLSRKLTIGSTIYLEKSTFWHQVSGVLCNTLIQRHLDYACTAWYPNLNKKLKNKV